MPPNNPPESEFARIARRLDALQANAAAPHQVLAYYRALADLFHGAQPLAATQAEPLAWRQSRLDAGQNLLPSTAPVFAAAPAEAFFRRVAQAVAAFQPGAKDALAALDEHRLDLPPVLAALAVNAPLSLEPLCESIEVAPLTLRVLLEYCLRPTLRAWAASLLKGIDLEGWQKPACPVCGTLPLLAEWNPDTHRRTLRCAICGSAWTYPLKKCPGCGTIDPNSQGMLSFDGDERYFAQTCRACRIFVKTIVTRQPLPHDLLSLEDLLSIDLDQGCRDKGYRRLAGVI